jgi:predicted ester cyclase
VLTYLDALNAHDPDRIAACVAVDFVNEHTSAMGHNRYGRAEYRTALEGFLAEFAQLRYDLEDLLVDGDRAAAAYRMSFELVSRGRAPVTVRGVFRLRVDEHGLIAHRIDYWDSGEVRRQLPPEPDERIT